MRADQIYHADRNDGIDWLKPIVADAEAGLGGVLSAFELMKAMVEAGATGVHFGRSVGDIRFANSPKLHRMVRAVRDDVARVLCS